VQAHEAPWQGNVLALYTNVAAPYSAVFDKPSSDKSGGVDGDSEAQSLRWQNDSRIDANDLPLRSHQGSTRVSRVERGISLNNIINEPPRAGPERSPQRAHHTGSHCALKAVRIANSNDQLPHPYGLRITELRWEKMRCTNPHHGQISRRVITDQVCWHTAPIGQGHKDAARVMHDMAIRQNKTIRSKKKPELVLRVSGARRGSVPDLWPGCLCTSMFTIEGLTCSAALITAWE
jgi:hypothetical protein